MWEFQAQFQQRKGKVTKTNELHQEQRCRRSILLRNKPSRKNSYGNLLVQEWEKKGVKVISLSPAESWSKNVDPLFRDLLIHMLAWVANMERKVLKERVKAGVAEYKDKHGRWGKKPREPNQLKVEKMLGEGLKLAQIAREMKIPPSTLYKWYGTWQNEKRVEFVENVK